MREGRGANTVSGATPCGYTVGAYTVGLSTRVASRRHDRHYRPYHTTRTCVRRLSQLDPWLPPDTAVRAAAAAYWSGGVQAADMSDEEYLDQFTTGITLLAVSWET